ncbi:CG14826 [Drosophila busckii]|uniref:CG14826 n=1 Tax=Drosophila busckii TaxID=30019 RepID=A0A0M4EAJ7_DROBS|nr:CG14826 [Drosophila busckii]
MTTRCALILSVLLWCGCGSSSGSNLTMFMLHRQRRGLIYQNSGSIKFSMGPSMPIPLGDHVTFRSTVLSYNIQGGTYSLPTTPIWPWDKWEVNFARSLQQMQRNIELHTASGKLRYADDSRLLVYTALEQFIGRSNNDMTMGRQCLLRSICENGQVHQHVGIFSEILNIVLSPGKADLDDCYHDAFAAGQAGANCLAVYKDCPRGSNFLDELLMLEHS